MAGKTHMTIIPVQAPVKDDRFELYATLVESIAAAGETLNDGDILAVSSKYTAISEGRIVDLDAVEVSDRAADLAARYHVHPAIAQLVVQEADHIFGGIPLGFLLTHKDGIISPNAGIDRSNIPQGRAVLFPAQPYEAAAAIRAEMRARLGVEIGVVLTDSWLMPGRWGTTGVALACAGFRPIQDERGKADLFGNPMQVTQRSIADTLAICAQMVMGERDEATPIGILRGTGVEIVETTVRVEDIAIPWEMCIYVESLTLGLLPDGAPRESLSARLIRRDPALD
jgi:coenzyme F420-0:L-glutamate ligase